MRVIVGTSGYSYKEWKGTFYPEDLPAAKMLSFYAQHFSTVEINNSFYRMPDAKTVAKWAGEVPDGFTFVLKAPQRITHQKKLIDTSDDIRHFFEVASELGPKLGPVLFQLPPFSRKDAQKLRDFLRILPRDRKIGFEFRHASWFDDETYGILRDHDVALCAADTDESGDPDALVVPTASWGYLRLRRTEYASAEIAKWAERVERQPWSDAFVFFKHEDEGKGPAFAKEFVAALRGA
ncbi:MAG TPA: DUF72 domain-containing protein [Thermoanaerobaculia bacterium]|nr:DUF72 domain-containing protein [Thermoanaerobaculia bacterium]